MAQISPANVRVYGLDPRPDQQKSFYGKACVLVDFSTGDETLYSYDTPIVRRHGDGSLARLYDGWSATTGRHIKAFCGLTKREFMALPLA